MTHEDTYLTNVRRNPTYFCMYNRPSWMTDEQWRQADAYRQGIAIPTDSEIIEGFQHCTDRHSASRAARWAYSNVSGFIVNEPNYTSWCAVIRKYGMDPDLIVDEGL